MDNFFATTQKLCLIFLVFACSDPVQEPKPNQLLNYWQRKLDLSQEERKNLALINVKSSDDGYLKAISHFILGNFSRRDLDHAKELSHYSEAQSYLIKSGTIDDKLLGHIYRNRGLLSEKYEQYNQAVSYYDSALAHYNHYPQDFVKERLGTNYNKGIALSYFDLNRSIRHFKELLSEALEQNNQNYEVRILRKMGDLNILIANYQEAEFYYQKALTHFEEYELNNKELKVYLLTSMGRVYYYTGNFVLQETYLKQALDLDVKSEAFLLNVDLGENLYKQARIKEAYDLLSSIEVEFDQQPYDRNNLRIYELLLLVSPNSAKVSYYEKSIQKKKEYESLKQAVLKREKQQELQSISYKASYKLKHQRESKAEEKIEIYWIAGGYIVLVLITILSIVIAAYHINELRKFRKRINKLFDQKERTEKAYLEYRSALVKYRNEKKGL